LSAKLNERKVGCVADRGARVAAGCSAHRRAHGFGGDDQFMQSYVRELRDRHQQLEACPPLLTVQAKRLELGSLCALSFQIFQILCT
jgi:hypothetical protein